MAEGVSKILCRYFVHGACKNGDDCAFSHDVKSKPSLICKYYQLGLCSYGSGCRYDHVRDAKHQKSAVKSLSSQTSCNLSGVRISQTSSITTNSATLKPATSTRLGPVCPPVQLTGSCNSGGRMVTLRHHGETLVYNAVDNNERPVAGKLTANEWVNASEFVPGQQWRGLTLPGSYIEAAQSGSTSQVPADDLTTDNATLSYEIQTTPSDFYSAMPPLSSFGELCPYAAHGECPYGAACHYVHGDICDMCHCAVLSPFDPEQRQHHEAECMLQHERDMELSFAVQRSEEKVCGICMDVVWQKEPPLMRRFGILSDCCHVYCLDCIRKWRGARQFENKIIRACPECRVKSDFVTPSKFWVEDKADKEKLINTYKQALSTKPCKYFDEGRGECPFNDRCFYLHAYPDGRRASPKPIRRRFRQNADGDVTVVHQILLWDFLEDIDGRRRTRAVAADPDGEIGVDDNVDWEEFFVRLQLLGFALPSDDEDDDDDE